MVELADAYGPDRKIRLDGVEEITVDTHHSGGWYDVALTTPSDATFSHQLAGRLESAARLTSDPQLGRSSPQRTGSPRSPRSASRPVGAGDLSRVKDEQLPEADAVIEHVDDRLLSREDGRHRQSEAFDPADEIAPEPLRVLLGSVDTMISSKSPSRIARSTASNGSGPPTRP